MSGFTIIERCSGKVLRSGSVPSRRMALAQPFDRSHEELLVGPMLPSGKRVGPSERMARLLDRQFARRIKPTDVKAWAARLLSYSDWAVVRQFETGSTVPPALGDYRQQIRAACAAVEAMSPIPADFQDPRYWPQEPK